MKQSNRLDNWSMDNMQNLLVEWDYDKNKELLDLAIKDLTKSNKTKVYWICPRGHSYQARVDHRTYSGSGCPICTNKQVLRGFNDLAKDTNNINKLPLGKKKYTNKRKELITMQTIKTALTIWFYTVMTLLFLTVCLMSYDIWVGGIEAKAEEKQEQEQAIRGNVYVEDIWFSKTEKEVETRIINSNPHKQKLTIYTIQGNEALNTALEQDKQLYTKTRGQTIMVELPSGDSITAKRGSKVAEVELAPHQEIQSLNLTNSLPSGTYTILVVVDYYDDMGILMGRTEEHLITNVQIVE